MNRVRDFTSPCNQRDNIIITILHHHPFTFTGSSKLTLQAACVVAVSQENAATGDPKTGDAMNAIVSTLCQNTKLVDLPHINKLLLGIQGLLVQMTLEREYGEGERDDDGHFVVESVDSTHLEHGDWALERAPYNQDGDDNVTVLDLQKSFREHGWCQGVKDRPQVVRNTSKAQGYYFLLGNALSASAMKAEWEAHPLDPYIVASVQMRLRNCFRWNPKTPKYVQVGARSLGNMFGGGRQSCR